MFFLISCANIQPLEKTTVITKDGYAGIDQTFDRNNFPFRALSVENLVKTYQLTPKVEKVIAIIDPAIANTDNPLTAQEILYRLQLTLPKEKFTIEVLQDNKRNLISLLEQGYNKLDKNSLSNQQQIFLVFSHWNSADEPSVTLSKILFKKDNFCLYWIGVNDKSPCPRLIPKGECGFAVTAEQIAQPRAMQQYAKRVFYHRPNDSDQDGIYDYQDKCPNTPLETKIDWDGCSW